jgi:hypothetical protein
MRKTSKSYRNIKTFGSISAESLSITDQFTLPLEDGEAGQVLVTDGAGTVSWLGLGSLSINTDGVPEGTTNLYYTPERVDDRVAALIKNGLGLNWTYNDVANTLTGNVTLAPFSTSNLSEGSNLYYTGERVDDRVATSLIKNGTGISWVYVDNGTGAGTLTPTVSLSPFSTTNLSEGVNLYFTNERAQDAAAALIKNGVGISWVYNDIANNLTPTVTLSPFTTDNLAEGTTNLYFTDERVDDRVAALVQDTATVTWSYSDNGLGAGVLEATAVASMSVQDGGTLIGTRNIINFIEGSGVTLNISDDSINSRIDVIISSTGGSGGSGTLNTILSSGLQVGDPDIIVLNFLNKFSVTESPNQQVNIDIDMLIDELSDVIFTSPISDGDALVYDSGTGMWTNSQLVGMQGAQGATGAQGDIGAQGSGGDPGVTGAQGNQGDQGATGAQGDQGATGDQGAAGAQGFQGYQGVQGSTGSGSQGDQGAQGYQGPSGDGSSPTILVNAMHYFKDGMYDYSSDSRVHVHGTATEGWWATFTVSTTSGIKLTPGAAPTSLLANTYHSSLITVPSNILNGATIYLTYTVFSPMFSDSRDQIVWYLGKVPSSELLSSSYVVTPLMPSVSSYVISGSSLISNTAGTNAHRQETISFTTSSAITSGDDSLVIGFASRFGGDLSQSPVHLSYKLWY